MLYYSDSINFKIKYLLVLIVFNNNLIDKYVIFM